MWQMLGFFLGWLGLPGKGRAFGAGPVKFSGEVTPSARKVTFHLDIKRLVKRKLSLALADGPMIVAGQKIYQPADLPVGVFAPLPAPRPPQISWPPHAPPHSPHHTPPP